MKWLLVVVALGMGGLVARVVAAPEKPKPIPARYFRTPEAARKVSTLETRLIKMEYEVAELRRTIKEYARQRGAAAPSGQTALDPVRPTAIPAAVKVIPEKKEPPGK